MGITTQISWCDSTINLEMGCEGCELWDPKNGVRICYAGIMTERYAGRNGWPDAFSKPKIFPNRLSVALNWPDLAGTERIDKPWLDGYPRLIFLDDMGDTFSQLLPQDWLLEFVPRMEDSKHQWQFLTKRARQQRLFFEGIGYVPENFWLGVTVTSVRTLARWRELNKIQGESVKWISFEPLMGPLDVKEYLYGPDGEPTIQWAVIGGDSTGQAPMRAAWGLDLLAQLEDAGVNVFWKQWGTLDQNPDKKDPTAKENRGTEKGGCLVYGYEHKNMPGIVGIE